MKCFPVAGVVLLESFVTCESWPSVSRKSADDLHSYQAKFVTCQLGLRGYVCSSSFYHHL